MSDQELTTQLDEIKKSLEALNASIKKKSQGGFLAENLKMSVGTVVAMLIFVTTGALAINSRLASIEKSISDATIDSWNGNHMRAYNYQLKDSNPAIITPNVEEIRRSINP